MTTILFFKCFVAGMLGILAHILFVKLPSLKNQAKAANLPFSIKDYFRDDWIALSSSVLTVFICLFVLDEALHFKPAIIEIIKWLFLTVGFTGSSILQAALGRTGKSIRSVVDEKTNIADAITGDGTGK